ncbi:MAG: glutamine-hydrolyzing GMP synthase [Candidatus Riflebacteria bacterium]
MKTIAVLDFGGQYTHLIATRVRELGIKTEIFNPEEFNPNEKPDLVGVIFSGGPGSVTENDFPTITFDLKKCPVPVLGLCYGHQLIAKLMGGKVEKGSKREYGSAQIKTAPDSALFGDLPNPQRVWMSHGDHVSALPASLRCTAGTEDLEIAAFESSDRKLFGLQFHPEVNHTEYGKLILDHFVGICTDERPWQTETYHREIIEEIRSRAGNKKLLLLLSGGVDSLVALKLCLEAVGSGNVMPVHVDTGMMREGESKEIIRHLAEEGFGGVKVVEAENLFLSELAGVTDPEKKRGIIGRLFIEIVEKELQQLDLNDAWCLVQGTIYPDHIESGGSRKAHKIKTHHNRVGEIEKLIQAGKVIEPLHNLYKDEVRKLGKFLKLPDELLNRHPFPGPGLGIRILCSNGEIPESGWNREDDDLNRLLKPFGLNGKILPIKSVGVQGDARTYLHPALIWSNSTEKVKWQTLIDAGKSVVNSLKTVNRVVWSSLPLENEIVLQKAFIDRQRLERLRKVDAQVRRKTAAFQNIWQMPVVSLPAKTGDGREIFIIRPISSKDAMTADVFEIPNESLKDLYKTLNAEMGNLLILYDLTSKPPGTIEWE